MWIHVQYIREKVKSRNALQESDFIGGVRRKMKSVAMHVNQCYIVQIRRDSENIVLFVLPRLQN